MNAQTETDMPQRVVCKEWLGALLLLVAEHECHDAIWWNMSLEFFVNCNDTFCWACADAEPITEASLEALAQALKDAEDDGPLLYCCRQRKMRPQGALYEYIDQKHWPLFDACGPLREVDFGNPKARP